MGWHASGAEHERTQQRDPAIHPAGDRPQRTLRPRAGSRRFARRALGRTTACGARHGSGVDRPVACHRRLARVRRRRRRIDAPAHHGRPARRCGRVGGARATRPAGRGDPGGGAARGLRPHRAGRCARHAASPVARQHRRNPGAQVAGVGADRQAPPARRVPTRVGGHRLHRRITARLAGRRNFSNDCNA